MNAITGSPCGYFFPETSVHAGQGRVLAVNVSTTGYIAVIQVSIQNLVGFVSKNFVNGGTGRRFGIISESTATTERLHVTIPPGSDPVQIAISNGPDGQTYPYLGFAASNANTGGVQGQKNIGSTSTNYALLTSTKSTRGKQGRLPKRWATVTTTDLCQ